MSKTLYIARHAKAEDVAKDDFSRKLTPSGQKDARKVAARLLEMEIQPDLVVSSPAPRALETAEILVKTMELKPSLLKTEQLIYDAADVEELYNWLRATPDKIDSLMIVGHNPYLKDLADLLFEKSVEWLPKGAVAGLEFDTDSWKTLQPKTGVILFFTHPKEFIYYDIYQMNNYEENEQYSA